MDPKQRHEEILRHLASEGPLGIATLARRLGASEVTIRRDLSALAEQSLLRRTRGGAAPAPAATVEFVFGQARQAANLPAKRAIGRAVAERIRPGQTLSLDTGTTTLEVARHLPRSAHLRVLTSSLAIASLLQSREDIELVLLGGLARKGSPDLYGPVTEQNLREFRVDMAVLGADAAGPDGLFTTDQRIAGVSRAMIASAAAVVLAADAGKFSARAFVRFATWKRVGTIVTDTSLPARARRWLGRTRVELVLVKPDSREARHG